VPALTFFVIPLGAPMFAPSALFPQAITNSLMIWAVVNTVLGLAIGWLLDGRKPPFDQRWAASIGIAVATVAAGYLALAIVDFLFKVDFRFWVVALRPLTRTQFFAFLAYLAPFTLFVLGAFRGLERLMLRGDGAVAQYLTAAVALSHCVPRLPSTFRSAVVNERALPHHPDGHRPRTAPCRPPRWGHRTPQGRALHRSAPGDGP